MPKPIRLTFKDEDRYFQYVCGDCADEQGLAADKSLTLQSLKIQAYWRKRFKLAALKGAIAVELRKNQSWFF